MSNYIAYEQIPVRIVGRLYGFKITDVEDYPLWAAGANGTQPVFRTKSDTTNTTGLFYPVGANDQNGGMKTLYSPPSFPYNVLPMLSGNHPYYQNLGALKAGYAFRYSVTTIGNHMENGTPTPVNGIKITPSFRWISENGLTSKNIDIWYRTTVNGKPYFLKLGTESTKSNANDFKDYYKLGDPYRNVPVADMQNTANILGVTLEQMKEHNTWLGFHDLQILTQWMRTFTKNTNNLPGDIQVTPSQAKSSIQTWYGEYCLPADIYICPAGTDVMDYAHKNNGLTYKESFWIKDNGFIVVNFKIETLESQNANNTVLSYWNSPNANMWRIEGGLSNKRGFNTKTRQKDINYSLRDGDIVFYFSNKSMSDDYKSMGTH